MHVSPETHILSIGATTAEGLRYKQVTVGVCTGNTTGNAGSNTGKP